MFVAMMFHLFMFLCFISFLGSLRVILEVGLVIFFAIVFPERSILFSAIFLAAQSSLKGIGFQLFCDAKRLLIKVSAHIFCKA